MKSASDILQAKATNFNFIDAKAMVSDALNMLSSMNCTFLVVMEEGEFKGVFSEHEFVKNVAIPGWDANVCVVSDVMMYALPAASPYTLVDELVTLFDSHHTRYVPVFDGHRFEGIITVYDILHLLLQDSEALNELQRAGNQLYQTHHTG